MAAWDHVLRNEAWNVERSWGMGDLWDELDISPPVYHLRLSSEQHEIVALYDGYVVPTGHIKVCDA